MLLGVVYPTTFRPPYLRELAYQICLSCSEYQNFLHLVTISMFFLGQKTEGYILIIGIASSLEVCNQKKIGRKDQRVWKKKWTNPLDDSMKLKKFVEMAYLQAKINHCKGKQLGSKVDQEKYPEENSNSCCKKTEHLIIQINTNDKSSSGYRRPIQAWCH